MTDKALIPNKQLEEMFFRVATDEQIKTYLRLVDKNELGLATAQASKIAYKAFFRAYPR